MNTESTRRKISITSLFKFLIGKWWILLIAAIACAAMLTGAYIKNGSTFSESSKEIDIASQEEIKELEDKLATYKTNLKNNESKLLTLGDTLKEHENNLAEYEKSKEEDIYNSTSPNRVGVKTLYQLKGSNEGQIDKIMNEINSTYMKMYEEIATKLNEGETTYNVQRLFATDQNLNLNQITITTSRETEELLREYIDGYHNWINDRFKEAKANFEENDVTIAIAEENIYTYYDTAIFNQQRSTADNLNNRRNNIVNTKNNINTANNDIIKLKENISDTEELLAKATKNQGNTIEKDGKNLSKKAIITYAAFGGVIGIVLAAIVLAFVYMYGKKLRDYDNLRMILGTDAYDGIDNEKMSKAMADIALKAKKTGRKIITIVSTLEETRDTANKLTEITDKYGIEVSFAGNPITGIDAVDALAASDAVIILEGKKRSKNKDIEELVNYLDGSHVDILGGICC